MKKTIWAHTLVKNEERYLWYSVMSVINFVDKVLLWDTGSTDRTPEIIQELREINGDKVSFKEVGEVDIDRFTAVRQQMLEQTGSDWLIIVDGDEVWWEASIKEVVNTIQKEGSNLETIVSPYYNIVGDIYHYQETLAGRYEIDGKRGHFNIRAINRRILGLHLKKPHGQQGFYGGDGNLIQNREKEKRKFLDFPYLHFTNMERSFSRQSDQKVPKRDLKFKYEIGLLFPKGFKYPEVFYKEKPDIVPDVWDRMTFSYRFRATLETFLRKLKRKLLKENPPGY